MGNAYEEDYDLINGQYWLADGNPDFGLVTQLDFLREPAPIRLYEGTDRWGAIHIRMRHKHWLKRCRRSVPELLWVNCGRTAKIYRSRRSHLFHFVLNPSSLIVLKYFRELNIFSVTTMYGYDRGYQDEEIAQYFGAPRPANNKMPPFTLFTPPPVEVPAAVDISVKRAKSPAAGIQDEGNREVGEATVKAVERARTQGVLSLKRDPSET